MSYNAMTLHVIALYDMDGVVFCAFGPKLQGRFAPKFGAKWPNFGAKLAQLQKPAISPKSGLNLSNLEQKWPVSWAHQ